MVMQSADTWPVWSGSSDYVEHEIYPRRDGSRVCMAILGNQAQACSILSILNVTAL